MDDVRVRCEVDAEEEEPPRGRAGAGRGAEASVALGADLFFFSPAVEAALPMLNTATVAGDDQWRRGNKFGDWEDVRVSRSHVSCGGPARGRLRFWVPLKFFSRLWQQLPSAPGLPIARPPAEARKSSGERLTS